ncbi:MAG: alpha/beta hydrolase [Deltaproteobacteria bacterium]|nr:alpha/beta hydrolase [Deltaproteobacteria bacterium]
MADQFVMCARAVEGGVFIAEPGPSLFLIVPEGDLPSPKQAVKNTNQWFKKLRTAATWGKDSRNGGRDRGDLLVFVHGYNNNQKTVMDRHAQLKSDLTSVGFKGEILSFDWPSDDWAINYLEDRHDAKKTAMQLVSDGILALSARQAPDCTINIHLLGHSTGAYVIREAFDDADDARLPNNSWTVSQVAFIGGDISSSSLTNGNSSTDSLYRHCTRLTNYSNLCDSVLKLSNAKRLGLAPRVGRVGLPADAPTKGVNIDCTDYFRVLDSNEEIKKADQTNVLGSFDHSWHIGNKLFARDLFETIKGDLDRSVIPTRVAGSDGKLKLVRTK